MARYVILSRISPQAFDDPKASDPTLDPLKTFNETSALPGVKIRNHCAPDGVGMQASRFAVSGLTCWPSSVANTGMTKTKCASSFMDVDSFTSGRRSALLPRSK